MSLPSQRGISLVEIMVALAVGLFLTAGVVQIFLGNKQSYRVAEGSARIQENARFAMEFIAIDARMAGYQGCAGASRTVVNTLGASPSFVEDFDIPVEGFQATSASAWSPSVDASISSPLGGRDILTIRGAFGNGTNITGQPTDASDCASSSSYTQNLKVTSGAGFQSVDYAIASNCNRASIFQFATTPEASATTIDTGGVDLGACYAGTGELLPLETRSFYIRANASGIPSLYRQIGSAGAQELVEGVEDLQVLYGLDNDGDGAANGFVTANQASANWDQVVSLRICLGFRSVEDNLTTSDDAPPACADSQVNLTGNHLRRVFTTTIGLRNRLP